MNDFQDDHELQEEDLHSLFEKLEDGDLNSQNSDSLSQILVNSEHARSEYLEYFEMSSLLRTEAKRREEENLLLFPRNVLTPKKTVALSAAVAAAAILLLAVGLSFLVSSTTKIQTSKLEYIEGSVWELSGGKQGDQNPALHITEGSKLSVKSGRVSTQLKSGAKLIVQGPANVVFPKLDEPRLLDGWLWVNVKGGKRIKIQTPDYLIQDIGTKFGIHVSEEKTTTVHLHEGQLEIATRNSKRQKFLLDTNSKGLHLNSKETEKNIAVPLALDPFESWSELMNAEKSYAKTVLAQNPSGYWRLNEANEGLSQNEIKGGSSAKYDEPLNVSEQGFTSEEGFHGFENGNRNVRLCNEHEFSVITGLDSPEGVSQKEGSVSFWIRFNGPRRGNETLWYAGTSIFEDDHSASEFYLFLSPSGQINFFMDNGKHDKLLSSTNSLSDEQWYHISAAWKQDHAKLFVNGERVAESNEERNTIGPTFTGRNVRFGKEGLKRPFSRRRLSKFSGSVDEIALWPRALTPIEVRQQFHSARE